VYVDSAPKTSRNGEKYQDTNTCNKICPKRMDHNQMCMKVTKMSRRGARESCNNMFPKHVDNNQMCKTAPNQGTHRKHTHTPNALTHTHEHANQTHTHTRKTNTRTSNGTMEALHIGSKGAQCAMQAMANIRHPCARGRWADARSALGLR
jgi:hypothetical protein